MENRTTMDEEKNRMIEEPIPIGPGALLKNAREEKNLSQADIAKQLRLSLQWIRDLESDHYAYVPALIYVRGYLRSYARVVDISPEIVIEAFEPLGLDDQFKKAKTHEKKIKLQPMPPVLESRKPVNRKALRRMSALAILVLVVLVALWWSGEKKPGVEQQLSSPHQVGKIKLPGVEKKP